MIISRHFLLYGGTFDPFHTGHLVAVLNAHEKIKPFETHIIPAWRNPHRTNEHMLSDDERKAAIRRAIWEHDGICCSDQEIRNQTTSTTDTVKAYRDAEHDVSILIGEDIVPNVERWERYEELFSMLKSIVIIPRPQLPIAPVYSGYMNWVPFDGEVIRLDVPLMGISSSDIRERVRDGRPLHGMIHDQNISIVEKAYK